MTEYYQVPERIEGYKTSDGQIFKSISEARQHENEMAFEIWLEENATMNEAMDKLGLEPKDLREWFDTNLDRIDAYFGLHASKAEQDKGYE